MTVVSGELACAGRMPNVLKGRSCGVRKCGEAGWEKAAMVERACAGVGAGVGVGVGVGVGS